MTTALAVRRQCGTEWGYRLHRINDEPYCDACRSACATAARRRRRHRGTPQWQPAACGTPAGYSRHIRTGTEPCDPCRAAQAAYMRAWRAKRRRSEYRASISTRTRIRDILETWSGDWFTTNELVMVITSDGDLSETGANRAIHRLVKANPDWLDTDLTELGERRLRAPDRSYLWT